MDERECRAADSTDRLEIGNEDTLFNGRIAPISGNDIPPLAGSQGDIRASDPREGYSEHDIDATIASLESQVDHLCSLLDNFRSEFQTNLQAFREDIRTLPDRVGVAYSPRQQAYLLKMYGKFTTESGELALQKLQHDLQHLISLEGGARPYEEYCSVASSFVSCKSEMEATETVPDQVPDQPKLRQPLTVRLLRAAKMLTLASTPRPDPDSSAVEVALDNNDEHTPGQEEEQQHPPTKSGGVALRPHREVLIDWERFCGDCPSRAGRHIAKGAGAGDGGSRILRGTGSSRGEGQLTPACLWRISRGKEGEALVAYVVNVTC